MSNDKVAATFHGTPGRLVKVSVAPDLTPEQDLRAAVAERLTDAIHFGGCVAQRPGDRNCSCLIGRLHWAISTEQVPA